MPKEPKKANMTNTSKLKSQLHDGVLVSNELGRPLTLSLVYSEVDYLCIIGRHRLSIQCE